MQRKGLKIKRVTRILKLFSQDVRLDTFTKRKRMALRKTLIQRSFDNKFTMEKVKQKTNVYV